MSEVAPDRPRAEDGETPTPERLLDELIMPGTPDAVRVAYRTLAERARTTRFGLLEDPIVVLDTETTGLSFRDCELIEVSAAVLEGTEVTGRYETFVRPHGHIPPEIVRLTGIRDADVADAPSAEEAVAGLADFVGGLPVVAHNATFDRTFVESARGGDAVSDLWVDSLQLSRIALPRLSSHRLQDLAAAFGCDAVTHRSSDDVDALCGVWRVLLRALLDLPDGLLDLLAGMHEELLWPYRPILSQLAALRRGAWAGGASFSLLDARRGLVGSCLREPRVDAAELDCVEAPGAEEVRAAFSRDGLVGRMYPGFEERPEQASMASEVCDALATSTCRAIEAGTGVGKSMAYLVPLALFARKNRVTVGVATKTNALTDQLMAHELPALSRALPGGLAFTSLKGYDHYPCLLRLQEAAQGTLPLPEGAAEGASEVGVDHLNAIAAAYAFACQSVDGDLDGLGVRWKTVPRELLTISPRDCPKGRCPFYPDACLLHGARRRAQSCDVVVTNHALLLRDVAMDGGLLPPIRHWVVDEAHGLEAEARRQWAREVTSSEVAAAFERLGSPRSGVLRSLMARTARSEGSTLMTGLLSKVAAESARAQVATTALFEALHGLSARASFEGGYDQCDLWISAELRESSEWSALSEAALAAADVLASLGKATREAQAALAQASEHGAGDLGEFARLWDDAATTLRLVAEGTDDSYVYSAHLARSRRRMGQEALRAEKIDVGAELGQRWLPRMESVTFTSATMAVGESFQHFEHAVGLDTLPAGERRCVRLSSSFDYDHAMSVVAVRDMPRPGERSYLPALEDVLFDVHVAMGGSVLTLFTNRREMELVYEGLRPRLAEQGLDLACQERGSSPRRLRERFLAEESLSLLALRSFWEGFDAAGDTLRCVVIPKLPFPSPREPLAQEREQRDPRAWWHHALPEAVLSVKQAAGRLIRTASDTGVLVIADVRVVQKRYGGQFLSSLPSRDQQLLSRDTVGRYVRTWRTAHETGRR